MCSNTTWLVEMGIASENAKKTITISLSFHRKLSAFNTTRALRDFFFPILFPLAIAFTPRQRLDRRLTLKQHAHPEITVRQNYQDSRLLTLTY